MLNSDVPSLTPQLIADLFNEDYWTHQKAVQALLDLGFPRPPLTEDVLFLHLQQHAANIVRARAAMILGSLSDQRAIDALIRALADPNAEVRIEAARALAIHGDRVDFQVWLSLLDAPVISYSTLQGLMAHPQMLLSLLDAPHISYSTLRGLMAHPQAAQFMPHDHEQRHEIAAYATRISGRVTPEHWEILLNGLGDTLMIIRKGCVRALGYCSSQAQEVLPVLMPLLDDSDVGVRCEAISAVVHLGGEVPTTTRQRLLNDTATRKASALALGRLGDPTALAIISAELAVDHEFDRENAVSWIRTGSHTAETIREVVRHLPLSIIMRSLTDPYWPVSYPWAECVATLGADVPFAQVEALLQHADHTVRLAALHVLTCCGVRPPIAPPFALLDDPEITVRREAVEALLTFDVPVERLIPYLEPEHPDVAGVLAPRGSREAIAILLAVLTDGDEIEQWQAAYALTNVSGPLPVAPLLDALGTVDVQISIRVLEVLAKQPGALRDYLPAIIDTLEGGQRWAALEDLYANSLVYSLRGLVAVAPTMHAYAMSQLEAQRSSTQFIALRTLEQLPVEARERVEWLRTNSPSFAVRDRARIMLKLQSS